MGLSIHKKPETWKQRGGYCVKNTASILMIALVVAMLLASFSSNIGKVKADGNYSIEHISHTISILYTGHVLINDTITLNETGQAGPSSFLMGFPSKYGQYVLKCFAYSESGTFPVTLSVPLGNRLGFYGVSVDFAETNGAPRVFNLVFMLSNNLLQQDALNSSLYLLDFPAYPSLTEDVGVCNASIVVPKDATYVGGTVGGFTYGQANLPAFTHLPANLAFVSTGDTIQIVDIVNLRRELTINEFGAISGADTYQITNMADKKISYLEVFLPSNTSDVHAEDQVGRSMGEPLQIDSNLSRYMVNFASSVEKGRSSRFTVKYQLSDDHLTRENMNRFTLNLSMFLHENYYIDDASVAFILPEGAVVANLGNGADNSNYEISRSVFQETITVEEQGIIAPSDFHVGFTYEYNPLWSSFRPTLWVWALAIVGCIIVTAFWRMPKGEVHISLPAAEMKLKPEHLKSFVDTYDEKKKILTEIASLEAKVEKGKIPRRRYKVLRKTMEARLSTLSRSLTEFKERTGATGGKYLDLMRQLEVAETEIAEVEANVKSIEARLKRGELSLEAHRKLLGDYQHRKENAERTINGILLRLREETG
jgi:hypothetical protein